MTKGEELARKLVDCNMTAMMGSRYYFVPYSLARDIVEALKNCEECKTGRWVEHDDFDNSWECSSCNEVIDIIEGTPIDNEYRFCPFCGAKMEGAEE